MIETIYQAYLACNGVCTDSRACQEGNLFVCLKGENFDGNNFAEKAVEMGCKYVLTSRKDLLTSDESLNRGIDESTNRLIDSPNHQITD